MGRFKRPPRYGDDWGIVHGKQSPVIPQPVKIIKFKTVKQNRLFEFFVITVIIISALEIGAKTYDLSPTSLLVTKYLDVFITLFFLFEITVRFVSEENKKDLYKRVTEQVIRSIIGDTPLTTEKLVSKKSLTEQIKKIDAQLKW